MGLRLFPGWIIIVRPEIAGKLIFTGRGPSMEKLLELLEQDCTMTTAQLAAAAGVTEAEAKAAFQKYED